MNRFFVGVLLAGSVFAQPSFAAVSLSFGSGSAVTTVDAAADFESTDALFDEPYLEDGLSFSRTLTHDNNGCGYAGCGGHIGFTGFSGNYMYGTGGGYFEISTTGNDVFDGLEFVIGTGFSQSTTNVAWEAFLNNASVGSGFASNLNVGTVVGFSGSAFDRVRYTDNTSGDFAAPAFDTVRADLTAGGGVVPEPATWALMIAGFGLAGGTLRRQRIASHV